jgi:hypothetical protein
MLKGGLARRDWAGKNTLYSQPNSPFVTKQTDDIPLSQYYYYSDQHPMEPVASPLGSDPFWIDLEYEPEKQSLDGHEFRSKRIGKVCTRKLHKCYSVFVDMIQDHKEKTAKRFIRKEIQRTLKDRHQLFLENQCLQHNNRSSILRDSMVFSGDMHLNAMQAKALIEKSLNDEL